MSGFESLLAHYGYLAIFAAVFLEDFGVPAPGETALIAGAIEAGRGQLHFFLVVAVAFVAATAGDNVGYAIGRFGGRRLVLRYGRVLRLTPERLKKAEDRFRSFGPAVVVIARFVEVLRQLNGILAGISGMSWPRFLLFNAAGAALWVGFWGTLFFKLGKRAQEFAGVFKRYELPALAVAVLLIGGFVAVRLLRRRARPE